MDGSLFSSTFCHWPPLGFSLLLAAIALVSCAWLFYLGLYLVAPIPRLPLPSEKRFTCVGTHDQALEADQLPCWQDVWYSSKAVYDKEGDPSQTGISIENAELFLSLVVPAFNEQDRLKSMLDEATEYLQRAYGASGNKSRANGSVKKRKGGGQSQANGHSEATTSNLGWEILVVSDGSTDGTVDIALQCARGLASGLRSSIRVIQLEKNRGKGGAVIHGMRHVRGQYTIFADADGASKFEDLGKLLRECERIEDGGGRGVAVGSRAHLVGSEAVVKRSFVRNFLMHSFHILLRLLTPPATAAIRDTQCGFKLFSRPALPYIIPYMHSEGWIFDVEMLMLAESANIPVAEVPVGWHEVTGSKLNVLWDSLAMAWGLAILRLAWGLGVYKRS